MAVYLTPGLMFQSTSVSSWLHHVQLHRGIYDLGSWRNGLTIVGLCRRATCFASCFFWSSLYIITTLKMNKITLEKANPLISSSKIIAVREVDRFCGFHALCVLLSHPVGVTPGVSIILNSLGN